MLTRPLHMFTTVGPRLISRNTTQDEVLLLLVVDQRHNTSEHSLFLTFLRSRGGSLRARMTRDDADGTTDTLACRYWMVSCTVILRPFLSAVALQMSSPIFLGD